MVQYHCFGVTVYVTEAFQDEPETLMLVDADHRNSTTTVNVDCSDMTCAPH